MTSRRFLLGAAAAVAMTCGGSVAAPAQTEIQWWHAMGGQLGEAVNGLAEGFNKSQKDYKVVPVYKGTYTETMTGAIAAFRAKQAAAHRAGLRGRHRDDDGRQGRDLSGVPADGRRRGDVRSQGLSAGGLRLLLDDRRQAPVDAVQLLDAGPLLQQGGVREGRPRPQQAAEDLAGGGRIREEARGRRATSAGSPASGRPGCRSRISAPGTTCHLPPRRTASPAPTPSSSSTIRRASGTSRTSPTGRRRRSSSMAAARASRTRSSPPASAR